MALKTNPRSTKTICKSNECIWLESGNIQLQLQLQLYNTNTVVLHQLLHRRPRDSFIHLGDVRKWIKWCVMKQLECSIQFPTTSYLYFLYVIEKRHSSLGFTIHTYIRYACISNYLHKIYKVTVVSLGFFIDPDEIYFHTKNVEMKGCVLLFKKILWLKSKQKHYITLLRMT